MVVVSLGAGFDTDFDFLDLVLVSVESAIVASPSPSAFRFVDPVSRVLVVVGASIAVAIRGMLGVGDSVGMPNTAFIFEYASSQSTTINELEFLRRARRTYLPLRQLVHIPAISRRSRPSHQNMMDLGSKISCSELMLGSPPPLPSSDSGRALLHLEDPLLDQNIYSNDQLVLQVP